MEIEGELAKRKRAPTAIKGDKAYGRSRVSNGKKLFADATADGRSGWSRRLRDLIGLHTSDIGPDDVISAAEHSIIRRAAAITVELELLETRFALANGAKPVELDLYVRSAGGLRRLLEAIGLKRDPGRARDVTPVEDLVGRLEPTTIDGEVVK
jgi:hypothetical protein